MANEADQLASKLENYVLQLRQVEAALEVDPTHVELLKIKADLNELIDLTKKILSEKIDEGASCSKRAKLSADSATTSASATRDGTASSNLLDSEDAKASAEGDSQPVNTIDGLLSTNACKPNVSHNSPDGDSKDSEDKVMSATSFSENNSGINVGSSEPCSSSSKSLQDSASVPTAQDEKDTSPNPDDMLLASSLHVVAYDKEGNRFTLTDYMNRKVTDKKLINYFAKHKRRLNQMCINDHRVMHGIEPIVFRKNKGRKHRARQTKFYGKPDTDSENSSSLK